MYSSMESTIDIFNNAGSRWFSPQNMRFHRTRILHSTFCTLPDGRALFITSDRDYADGRAYSVRLASWYTDDDGRNRPDMETLEHQTTYSRTGAMKLLRKHKGELAKAAAAFGSGKPSLLVEAA